MEWWYVKNGERQGPVEESELKAMAGDGRLDRGDLIWNSTMGQDWKKAGEVPGIFAGKPAASASDKAQEATPSQDKQQAAPSVSRLEEPARPAGVSVTGPVESAWASMKKILFQPFDMGKWFALGFSAWLATLMEGGGGSFNNFSGGGDSGSGAQSLEQFASGARSFWDEMQAVLVAAVVALVIVGFVVGIVLMWVRSRGKFMFLDNLVHNRDEVKKPWAEFAQHGNSLFKWTLGYSVIMLLIFLVLMASTVVGVVVPCIKAETFVTSTIPVIVIIGLLWIAVAIVGGYIMRFLEDFIIPIMYRKDMTATEAWSCFAGYYRANTGRMLGYGLFYLLLGMGAGMAVMLATILTCCILGCIAAIPYVGTVALLPVPVFFRMYSVHYIAQYGPDLDLVTGAECNPAG